MSINPDNQELLKKYEYYLQVEVEDNEDKRENTVKTYFGHVRQFINYLGDQDCLTVGLEESSTWLKSLEGRNGKISASTRNNKIAALNNFYNYLIDIEKTTDRNPFNGLKAKKITKKGKRANQETRDFLEKDEIKRLKKVLEEDVKSPRYKKGCVKENVRMNALRNRALLNLILCSGMRVGEVCNLELSEIIVNTDKNIIFINIPFEKDKGKRGRDIPVPMYVMDYINEYRNNLTFKNDSNLVFLSQNGKKLSQCDVANILSEYVSRAKIEGKKITPHSLRHSYGTHMVNNPNYKDAVIAKIMGHTVKQLLETYHHVSEEVSDIVFDI